MSKVIFKVECNGDFEFSTSQNTSVREFKKMIKKLKFYNGIGGMSVTKVKLMDSYDEYNGKKSLNPNIQIIICKKCGERYNIPADTPTKVEDLDQYFCECYESDDQIERRNKNSKRMSLIYNIENNIEKLSTKKLLNIEKIIDKNN